MNSLIVRVCMPCTVQQSKIKEWSSDEASMKQKYTTALLLTYVFFC